MAPSITVGRLGRQAERCAPCAAVARALIVDLTQTELQLRIVA